MVMTPSTMLELNTPAPDFNLPDSVSGNNIAKNSFDRKPLLVMFLSAHCPFVIHVQEGISEVAKDFNDKVAIVAICSNDISEYSDDKPEALAAQAKQFGFDFPYLFDETQEVAKSYTAACTPDVFLFDADHKLFYRGQLDSSRPGNGIAVDASDLRTALDALLEGRDSPADQMPSVGCNIKWKPGNEPDYFG